MYHCRTIEGLECLKAKHNVGFKLYVGFWACPSFSEAFFWPQGGHLMYFVVYLCVKRVFTWGGGIMYMTVVLNAPSYCYKSGHLSHFFVTYTM